MDAIYNVTRQQLAVGTHSGIRRRVVLVGVARGDLQRGAKV